MLLVVIAILFAVATAQQQQIFDPVQDFCRRHQHQTCIIDSKLYIDGGLIYYRNKGSTTFNNNVPERNTDLVWGDLSNLTSSLPPQYSNLTKTDAPTTSGGILWPDQVNKLFYLFGGEFHNATVESFRALWFYDTIFNTWNRTSAHGSQNQISWPAFGAGTVNDEGQGFYYGGYLNNRTTPGWIGGNFMLNTLVSYQYDTRQWTNYTTTDITPRAEGSLQYIPTSDRGMLVYFGGLEKLSGGNLTTYANMSQIHLIDIASTKWYTQTASGDTIPQPRRAFCAGVTWAADRSSYNIYVYGGIGADGTALGDVWILTLPSFKWISMYPDPQLLKFPGGKAWASCDIINKSHMLVISGFYTNSSRNGCDDPNAYGQHGMLLGEEMIEKKNLWHGIIPNTTTYRVPRNISNIIGGGVNGSATLTVPSGGFATTDLAIYFRSKYTPASRAPTRSVPTTSAITIGPTSTPTPSSQSNGSKKPNIGAIAGGAVGGAVLIIGAVVLACFFLRRKRRNQQQATIPVQELPNTQQTSQLYHHQHSPNMADKSVATFSISQNSALHSPDLRTPTYSMHGSPPPTSDRHTSSIYHDSPPQHHHHSGGDWNQQRGSGFSPSHLPVPNSFGQTYYPPPPDPSQSPSARSAQSMSVELPSVRSPANVELPDVRSPVPVRKM